MNKNQRKWLIISIVIIIIALGLGLGLGLGLKKQDTRRTIGKKYQKSFRTNNESRCAIVMLTRGYSKIEEYNDLIARNKHIDNQLYNKLIPLVICHEGNIGESHQKYIKDQTPALNIDFINSDVLIDS